VVAIGDESFAVAGIGPCREMFQQTLEV